MSQEELKKTIIAFTESYPYSNLITIDETGTPKGRMMENNPVGDDLLFYYATGSQSAKVKEIRNNPRASAYYYRPEDHSSISVQGKAEIVTDEKVKKEKWKEKWSAYWQQGSTDPAYTLIRIVPDKITYLDYATHKQEVLEM